MLPGDTDMRAMWQDRFSPGLSVYLMNGVGGPAGSKGVAKRCTEAIRTVGPTLIMMALIALGTTANAQSAPERQATFTKDVAPILQRSCQTCHRPDSIAPMSLVTYEEARPWAKAIKENVVLRNMPPWHIDPNIGISKFKNSVALADQEIATIAQWVDSGAPKGDPADMPRPRQFDDNDKWSIGTPDLIVEMPKDLAVPAKAPDTWKNILVDTGLAEDRYIKAVEVKPTKGFRTLHHMGATLIYPDGSQALVQAYGLGKNGNTFEEGSGYLISAGTKINFNLHIHPYGEAMNLNVAIGFKLYPKGYVPGFVVTTQMMGDDAELDLPPNTDNIRTDTYMTLMQPTRVLGFQPHMHTRGKAMCLEVIYPGGGKRPGSKVETLNCVPNYKFNWMIAYDYATDVQPLLPAGSVLHIIAWHNNTESNKLNPDPDTWVGYGQRSIDDMSHAWVTYYPMSEEEFKQQLAERNAKVVANPSGRALPAPVSFSLWRLIYPLRFPLQFPIPVNTIAGRTSFPFTRVGNLTRTGRSRCISGTSIAIIKRNSIFLWDRTTASIPVVIAANRRIFIRAATCLYSKSSCQRIGVLSGA